jgi:hypothetical protein
MVLYQVRLIAYIMLRCRSLVFPITDYLLPITSPRESISIKANMILCHYKKRSQLSDRSVCFPFYLQESLCNE